MQVNGYIKKWPMVVILTLTAFFSLLIIANYAAYSMPQSEESSSATVAKRVRVKTESSHRGAILDRNGKALAVATNFYHFGVTPSAIKNPASFAREVSPILGERERDIAKILSDNANSSFVYIKQKIDQPTYEDLKRICDKNGWTTSVVRYDKIPGRVYPENRLASQLVGFMGAEGKGLAGIEYSMNDVLSSKENEDAEVESGKNIYLTIDANLQSQLETVATDVMSDTKAESLMMIAANARTGEILSYISLPSANLNEYGQASDEERKNRPVTDSYEPGSVFKVFTVAEFLDSGVISPDERFFCDGVFEKKTSSGERIKITCLEHHGSLTARDALKYSCNDALAQMSEKIESEAFLRRLRSLGFGSKTGVELSGETSGSLKSTSDRLWSARSKPTIAIGQEVGVNALQMVQAMTAVANGGVPLQLTFINKISDSHGNDEFVHKATEKERVLKSSTANYILSCMETVAESGTGSRSKIGDVSIGVKTGTAQMADAKTGKYSTTDFISNCIAVFPVENPEIILYVVIQKAQGEILAGRIAAPVINRAANVIIDHLGMSRRGAASLAHSGIFQIAKDAPIEIKDRLPNFVGQPARQLLPLLERRDLNIKIHGSGWVVRQTPSPGTPVTENMEIDLYLETSQNH